KAIASPDAIHPAHHVSSAARERAGRGVVEGSAPGMLARTQDLALRDRDEATAVALGKKRPERVAGRFDAEQRAHCLAVADQDIGLARPTLDHTARTPAR